jgi:TPR repeat protein/nucleoside-triphosphatase THEP1
MSPTNLIANTYNPHNQTPQELIDGFVVRKKEFEALFSEIKTDPMKNPPQHMIIQGRRGSGKTTFLLRIYHEVKNDAALKKWLIPLVFNEEQYSVRTLYKLWELVAKELENESEDFAGLPDVLEAKIESTDYEEICFDLLKSALQNKNKKLLLLIDNFGVMVEKFTEREQRQLREILITCSDIRIIGASAVALESTFDYAKPFFEFFKIIDLPGLSKEEAVMLLLALGEKYHKPQIKEIIEKRPGKIEALRRLTDGVPRTMILLFEIFVDDALGESFRDLDMVLDRVTPLYKHRMDELSAQQQELVDIIALEWDAMAVKVIARKSRMESKAISSQLRQLEKNKVIIKKTTSTKNYLYQISERFFNIWYLMRNGRRKEQKQVVWLTRFLEEWCDKEELMERAKGHLKAVQNGEVYEAGAFYMTEALAKTNITHSMQNSLIKETRLFLYKIGSQFSDQLVESDKELLQKAADNSYQNKNELALKYLKSIHLKTPDVLFLIGRTYHELMDVVRAEKYYRLVIGKGHADGMFSLALLYQNDKKDMDQAIKYYEMATEHGHPSAMNNLAVIYENEKQNFNQAEKYYKMAIEKGEPTAIYNMAHFFDYRKNDFNEAEKYYKIAIKKGHVIAITNLAMLYMRKKKDFNQAEPYFKIAIERGDCFAQAFLAIIYFAQRTNKISALKYITKAWEQNPRIELKILYPLILLWNDEFEKSTSIATSLFQDSRIIDNDYPIEQYLLLLIAKRQYNFALRLFQESPLNLRERYRPIYYALMYFMQDSHPDEFKKMGSELEQTVMEIVSEIKKMAETM